MCNRALYQFTNENTLHKLKTAKGKIVLLSKALKISVYENEFICRVVELIEIVAVRARSPCSWSSKDGRKIIGKSDSINISNNNRVH